MKIETKLELGELIEAPNVAELLTEEERGALGAWAAEGFQADLQSRAQWEERMSDAMKLALQLREEKTFPWPGASNVKFPLITVAAIGFHSRIYPALIQQPDIVHCCAYGDDPTGELNQITKSIQEHLSWQVFTEDQDWEAEQDKAFLVMAILGCAFKKSYFDRALKRNDSELVMPSDLVVNYWTKDLDSSPRTTHIQYRSKNYLKEKERQGLFLECEEGYGVSERAELLGQLAAVRNETQGVTPDGSDGVQMVVVLEQCCWLDLDGDGYEEPYVLTFRHDNSKVLRLRAAFFEDSVTKNEKGEVEKIVAEGAYTKYELIPSPDGGFYSLGFGSLLGPINKSIDTAVNQLIDAGTLKNAGGGFLGRGVRVKGGEYTFRPSEWKRVESTGDDLQKSIYPLPVPDPSPTLFQLLSLLIQYGEKIVGATETTAGENPGQNTKVGTMEEMVTQGLTIFSGIYKRVWRAMTEEFRKLYRLNQLYMNESQWYRFGGEQKKVMGSAYKLPATSISLSADPNYMSDGQRRQQAKLVKEAAGASPQYYNGLEVERFFLQTMKVPGLDKLLVKEVQPPGPPMEVQVEQLRQQGKMAQMQSEQQIEIMKLQAENAQMQLDFKMKMLELSEDADLKQAEVVRLQAQALLLVEQAGTVEKDAEIALIDAQIGAAKAHHDTILKTVKLLSDVQMKREEKKGD